MQSDGGFPPPPVKEHPASMAGGIQCRVVCAVPTHPRQTRHVFGPPPAPALAEQSLAFDEVTLALYRDRISAFDRPDSANPQGPARAGSYPPTTATAPRLIVTCPFSTAVAFVSTGSSRRGIVLEMHAAESGIATNVESDLLPDGAQVKAVQLTFASSEDRQHAYGMIAGQWQRLQQSVPTVSAPAPAASITSANYHPGTLGPPSHQQSAVRPATSPSQSFLQADPPPVRPMYSASFAQPQGGDVAAPRSPRHRQPAAATTMSQGTHAASGAYGGADVSSIPRQVSPASRYRDSAVGTVAVGSDFEETSGYSSSAGGRGGSRPTTPTRNTPARWQQQQQQPPQASFYGTGGGSSSSTGDSPTRNVHQHMSAPRPRYAPAAGGQHDPMAFVRVTSDGPASHSDLLSHVQRLQGQASTLLGDLRRATEDIDEDDVASFTAGPGQLRRNALEDVVDELEDIRHRRDQRRQLISRISPSTGRSMRDTLQTAAPTARAARETLLSSVTGAAADECKYCRVVVPDPSRLVEHRRKCAHRPVLCKACGLRLRAKDVPKHRDLECIAGPRSGDSDDVVSLASSTNSALASSTNSSTGSFESISPPTSPTAARRSSQGLGSSTSSESAKRRLSSSGSLSSSSKSRSKTATRSSSDSEGESGLSRREREKLRVRRVLEEQERERGKSTDSRKPRASSSSLSASGPRAAGGSGGHKTCKHCGKVAPAEHEGRCAMKVVTCKRCGEKVSARDAKRHAELCAARRADGATKGLSSSASARVDRQAAGATTRFKPRAASP